jgi:quinolinate synthase
LATGNAPPSIPEELVLLDEDEAVARVRALRAQMGERLLILGHHYQQDAVVQFADLRGDSYGLATKAAAIKDAKYIIFCGVHFMAESADILTPPDKVVILPDMRAGCTMADMADLEQVEMAWDEIAECTDETVIPVTYINSAANLKNFVGRKGGAICTSSNAAKIIDWAFQQGTKLFFFPDQHLGRNTCAQMGMSLDEMIVWDPDEIYGGHDPDEVARAKVLLWQGHCSVHMGFTTAHIAYWRKQRPDINIIVHPECTHEVVKAADFSGSTAYIIKTVSEAKPGTEWAIGTEIHLVNRLQAELPDRFVTSVSPFQCLCATMYRIRPQYLLWVLENLVEGRIVNQVKVPDDIAEGARVALQRMLDITG